MDLENLGRLLNDHQTGMSDFQDDHFVTARAGGTTYGQYKQSLRELYKRFRGLRELVYGENGQKFMDLEIRRLESKLTSNDLDEFDREELELKLKHKYLIYEESERSINDTYREFMRFYQQAEALKEMIGELTPQRRRELEKDMWKYRVKEMAAIDYLQTGRLKNTTIEFLSCMPEEDRPELYELIFNKEGHEQLINEYVHRKDVHQLPFNEMEIPKIDLKDVERLIEYNEQSLFEK